jgi:hypothetical protein
MSEDKRVPNGNDPELSVVVAIIAGGSETMRTCLTALSKSAAGLDLECIVPFDARLDSVEKLKEEFPWADFVDARDVVDADHFGDSSREHHDILRSIGLRMARAPIAALLEDHGTPSPNWCRSMLEVHRNHDVAGVGGSVENGVDRLLNWAVYFCDFGRYQNPVPAGPSEFISDSNVSYKREPLWEVKHLWFDAFHETSVNWELRRRGENLRLEPEMSVYQTRTGLKLLPALRERFVWGRSFAGTRSTEIAPAKRGVYAMFSFALPMLLTWRIFALGLKKKRHLGKLISALPLILLLETIWSAGEFTGYATGRSSALKSSEVRVAAS